MKLYAYKAGSKSAKALAEALGIKRIKHEGAPLKPDTTINWGASKIERQIPGQILNAPQFVRLAANKLTTFNILHAAGVSIPEFTESLQEATEWVVADHTVVARLKLTGHSGEGIVILEPNKDFNGMVGAPLYTKYIKKDQEYRIHVFQGEAFFVQRKARKMDIPDEQINWKVRNVAGGFIFAHKDVEVPDVARNEACNAVAALGLDFGAVDVIRGTDGKFYVLEVNTACGLEGTTLEKYVEKFNKFR